MEHSQKNRCKRCKEQNFNCFLKDEQFVEEMGMGPWDEYLYTYKFYCNICKLSLIREISSGLNHSLCPFCGSKH